MDDTSVCTPQLAESDSQHNTTSTPNAASVTDADKVINTKIDSAQVEGDRSEEELLKGLLTNDYCHVCEAVLLFESQRVSHYEGKKHAQKLKVYLQAKRAEKTNKESTGSQWTMTTDKDRFCELCNMVFSSHVVAKSHYEGKVHTKNLRKQGFLPSVSDRYTEASTLPSLPTDPDDADQKLVPEGGMEHLVDPAASTTTPSPEVDLKDPNKYCALCAASFNNPQMALQHYNGRKHQRNQARQELIKELRDDDQQATSLMCQMCSVQFNSVEMYQAHMQGNKHQIREKKVTDLCKSQQKVYGTFADELADYIQVQKARGITPKACNVPLPGDTQKADEKEQNLLNSGDITELHRPMPNFPSKSVPHHQSRPGGYHPADGWHSSYQGPFWSPPGWDSRCPHPDLPASGIPQFPSQPTKRRRQRKQPSSSSYTDSSSYSSSHSSSYSSSTSDSDSNNSDYRRRDRRRIRRSRKDKCRRVRDEEQRRRKRLGKERDNDSEERRREESGESDQERGRKRHHGERRQKVKKTREEDFELDEGERVMDTLKPKDMMGEKQAEVHIQTEMHVEQGNGGQDDPAKPKCRKEKKKMKEKVDTRTEEEKLWDDSILGC